MVPRFNPLDYPACLTAPARVGLSPWMEHAPFAFALVEMLRPRALVGLGDPTGASYCALCQAVDRLGLPSRARGVPAGQDDPNGGPKNFDELKAHHDPRYGRFSSLIPGAFANALPHFADGTIDLLHLDGRPAYEAVRRDFEDWLPKMSDRGVLLIHGVSASDPDFGAGKLWAEVRSAYRSFEFTHGLGLGVLAVGPRRPEALGPLLAAGEEETTSIREFYFRLGRQIRQGVEHRRLRGDYQDLLSRLAETEQLAQVFRLQCEERDEMLHRATRELEPIQRSLVLRCVKLLARVEWALAPAGSRRRDALHLARQGVGALRRRGAALVRTAVGGRR